MQTVVRRRRTRRRRTLAGAAEDRLPAERQIQTAAPLRRPIDPPVQEILRGRLTTYIGGRRKRRSVLVRAKVATASSGCWRASAMAAAA